MLCLEADRTNEPLRTCGYLGGVLCFCRLVKITPVVIRRWVIL